MTALVPPRRSANPFARVPLLWFLLLPPLIYLVLVLLPRLRYPVDIYSVATALVALLICWAIGQRREGPRRVIERLALFLIVATGYELALLLLLKPTYAHRLAVLP
ncbi:MAG TPA: hypothetical protein VJ787_09190, partial [Thermoleophilia bacterium]|nr:hypothetical protein [Thermoleophilia bacterium]